MDFMWEFNKNKFISSCFDEYFDSNKSNQIKEVLKRFNRNSN